MRRGGLGRRVCCLAVETGEQVKDQREDDAEEDGGSEGEVDGRVLAAPGEVSGQTAEGEAGFSEQKHGGADGDEEESESDERAAEVGHGDRVSRAGADRG